MVIVKLKGGLGNQMFQYAHGINFAKEKKQEMVIDLSWYEANNLKKIDTAREFKLENFNITKDIATAKDLEKFDTEPSFLQKVVRKLRVTLFPKSINKEYDLIKKNDNGKNYYLDGFFTNENYFVEISEIIRDEFTLKNQLGDEAQKVQDKILSTQNPVSLHIRRGDYVNNSETNNYHGTCSLEYYQKAIEIIKNKVGNDICIFVFSDDIDWAKNNLRSDSPTEYVSNPEIQDYEEMFLMSKCSHNIIANSTFSWWGAWLNQNPNKIVIAPQKWFNNQRENSNNKIVPDSWIKI